MNIDTVIIWASIAGILSIFALIRAWREGYKRGWHDKQYQQGIDEVIMSLEIPIKRGGRLED